MSDKLEFETKHKLHALPFDITTTIVSWFSLLGKEWYNEGFFPGIKRCFYTDSFVTRTSQNADQSPR